MKMQTEMERAMTRAIFRTNGDNALRSMRYGLEGALVGVALVGITTWIVGSPPRELYDVIGAVIGFVGVTVVRVIAHSTK
jgi:hypothetical protein